MEWHVSGGLLSADERMRISFPEHRFFYWLSYSLPLLHAALFSIDYVPALNHPAPSSLHSNFVDLIFWFH